MAKLKAPLMSLGASGQLGKSLVFFPWKGLDLVREYVVPSNPKTAGQLTQRAYMTAAVAAIHDAQALAALALGAADISAYALKGSTFSTPRTWFNQIVKFWLDVKVAVKTPCIYSDGQMLGTSKDDFRPVVYLNEETGSTLAAGKFYLGTSKTALITNAVAVIQAGIAASLGPAAGFSGLVAGTKYYWQFRPNVADGCEGADSGIYSAKAT